MQESSAGSADLTVVNRTHCVEHMGQRHGSRFECCGCLRRRCSRVSERNRYPGSREPRDRLRGALRLWSDGYERDSVCLAEQLVRQRLCAAR